MLNDSNINYGSKTIIHTSDGLTGKRSSWTSQQCFRDITEYRVYLHTGFMFDILQGSNIYWNILGQ